MPARHAGAHPPHRPFDLGSALWPRLAVAAGGGALVWCSFPPLDLWPAAFVGVAALPVAVWGTSRRRAALAGWVFGLAMFVPMLSFLRGLGIDAWLVLAVAEAGWFALLALATRAVGRFAAWPVLVALLWVAQEWARSRVPFGGFPWGRLAFGQAGGVLLPLAAIGGAVLVTLATALVGCLIAWLVVTSSRPRPVVRLGMSVAVVAV